MRRVFIMLDFKCYSIMKDWVHFVTILGTVIIVLLMISNLYGCSYFNLAKETAKVIDIITPDKKEDAKEIKVTDLDPLPLTPEQQYNEKMEQQKEFICTKIACADEVETWKD